VGEGNSLNGYGKAHSPLLDTHLLQHAFRSFRFKYTLGSFGSIRFIRLGFGSVPTSDVEAECEVCVASATAMQRDAAQRFTVMANRMICATDGDSRTSGLARSSHNAFLSSRRLYYATRWMRYHLLVSRRTTTIWGYGGRPVIVDGREINRCLLSTDRPTDGPMNDRTSRLSHSTGRRRHRRLLRSPPGRRGRSNRLEHSSICSGPGCRSMRRINLSIIAPRQSVSDFRVCRQCTRPRTEPLPSWLTAHGLL